MRQKVEIFLLNTTLDYGIMESSTAPSTAKPTFEAKITELRTKYAALDEELTKAKAHYASTLQSSFDVYKEFAEVRDQYYVQIIQVLKSKLQALEEAAAKRPDNVAA